MTSFGNIDFLKSPVKHDKLNIPKTLFYHKLCDHSASFCIAIMIKMMTCRRRGHQRWQRRLWEECPGTAELSPDFVTKLILTEKLSENGEISDDEAYHELNKKDVQNNHKS